MSATMTGPGLEERDADVPAKSTSPCFRTSSGRPTSLSCGRSGRPGCIAPSGPIATSRSSSSRSSASTLPTNEQPAAAGLRLAGILVAASDPTERSTYAGDAQLDSRLDLRRVARSQRGKGLTRLTGLPQVVGIFGGY